MESKTKHPDRLKALDYSKFKKLLRRRLLEASAAKEQLPYLMLDGSQVQWKGEEQASEDFPLLRLGDLGLWKKSLRGLDKKLFSVGRCRVEAQDKGLVLSLQPEKGGMAKGAALKSVARVFKKGSPKIFIQVQKTEGGQPEDTEELRKEVEQLILQLAASHKKAQALLEARKKATGEEEEQLKKQLAQELALIKSACEDWKDLVVERETPLEGIKNLETGQKLYALWAEKLKLDNEEEEEEEEAIDNPLEQDAVKAIERFFDVLRKQEEINPQRIQQRLVNVELPLKVWRKAAEKNGSDLSRLEELEQELEELKTYWANIRPSMQRYYEAWQQVEQVDQNDLMAMVQAQLALEEAYSTLNKQL